MRWLLRLIGGAAIEWDDMLADIPDPLDVPPCWHREYDKANRISIHHPRRARVNDRTPHQ